MRRDAARVFGFSTYVFTDRSAQLTTSGGSIFLLVKKDRGERHAKGLRSRPLDSGFLYGGLEGRRAYLSTCSHWCILRDLGSSDGVPAVFALLGSAGKPSTTFLQRAARLQALLPPDSCVLRPDGGASASPEEVPLGCTYFGRNVGAQRITNVFRIWKLGGCVSLSVFLGSAARRDEGISDSAEVDLIASNAPLRGGRHKARQNTVPH